MKKARLSTLVRPTRESESEEDVKFGRVAPVQATFDDLRKMLTSNGVTILEDEAVTIGDDYVLIGRRDRSTKWRSSADTLMQGTDPEKYSIMLDHQPNDYDAEAAAGTDLVLSGHTHGGHMFPAGLVGLILKSNDKLYGLEERENTTFIVTSGISGWAIPFKTGTHSEYVIIDIQPES